MKANGTCCYPAGTSLPVSHAHPVSLCTQAGR
jgi:hypothetical protein